MLVTIEHIAKIGKEIKYVQEILRTPHIRVNAGIQAHKSEIMIYKAGTTPNAIEQIQDKLFTDIRKLLESYIYDLKQLAKEYAEDITKENNNDW